jgi:hypothetical protein
MLGSWVGCDTVFSYYGSLDRRGGIVTDCGPGIETCSNSRDGMD